VTFFLILLKFVFVLFVLICAHDCIAFTESVLLLNSIPPYFEIHSLISVSFLQFN
jgi:hypothetical protein